ncbi:MAG TPA: SUF system NifU family Fe-S cluster assembly protein [Erysipelotrichaceae bacterium]|nr:SUF system NifU family Fe-S cluster assembly protein [Erysipelotrichaceae bacterium]
MNSLKDNPILKREIIMDHYENPRNNQLIDDENYRKIHLYSSSCLDDIQLQVLISQGVIADVRFEGIACAVATAAASIMSELIKGRSISQAEEIIENYFSMIAQKDYDEQLLKEAVVFEGIGRQVNRVNCATLSWKGLKQLLDEDEKR